MILVEAKTEVMKSVTRRVSTTAMCTKLALAIATLALFSASLAEANPAKVVINNEPPIGGVQPEVAAALLSMAQQQHIQSQRSSQQQGNNNNAQKVIRKYEKLLAEAQGKAKAAGVSLAHHGEGGQHKAEHHASLSENVAKIFKLPKRLLGLGGGGVSNHHQAEEKNGNNAAAVAAAAAAVKKAVRQAKQQANNKKEKNGSKNARKDTSALKKKQFFVAKVTGTTAGGHSSAGHQSYPTAASGVREYNL